jgi:glycosyltransferase involved in cell wall biosynthesis
MISAVVCSKNRTKNLEQAVNSWLNIPEIDEIIILDWGSDIPVDIKHKKIRLFRVEQKLWHLTKAYNVAIQLSNGEQILKLDADYVLYPEFLKEHKLQNGMFYTGISDYAKTSCQGLLFCWKKDFLKCNGYDERIAAWGYDDSDLTDRLIQLGLISNVINFDLIEHIPHTDLDRVKYYEYNLPHRMHLICNRNKNKCKSNPWTKKNKMTVLTEL